MGNNFFLIPKADEELKKLVNDLLDDEDYDEIRNILPEKIHIGKSSMGWEFLFNHNDMEYYNKSKLDMIEFTQSGKIVDEYDRELTDEEFWAMVDRKVGGYTEKTRMEEFPEEYGNMIFSNAIIKLDTYEDGLRWCGQSIFS